MHEPISAQPCALTCTKIGFDNLLSSAIEDVTAKYHPLAVTPYFMDEDGVPIAIECIMCQLGAEHVIFADTTLCHTVQGQLAETTKVSIQIPDHVAAMTTSQRTSKPTSPKQRALS